jgi:signal peptidase complex subunit 3
MNLFVFFFVLIIKKLNEVVVWDKIILKGENTKLDLKGAKTKYYLWDDGDGLR